MSGAWGTVTQNGTEIIQKVWTVAPSGGDGDMVQNYTLRLPQSGEDVEPEDAGLRFDGRRPAAIIITSGERVNNAVRQFKMQCMTWERGLVDFGPDVYRAGSMYLAAAFQAAKIVLLNRSTYDDAKALKIVRAASLGALDVTSPEVFADSAYAQRSVTALTGAFLWVDTDGNRVNLANAVDYGTLVDERPFTNPTTWRS